MRSRLIPILLLAISGAAQAQQETEDGMTEEQAQMEAAATNATLAMKICLQNYRDPDGLLGAFQQAGFAYTPEDFGDGEILHWFVTPDENVQTAVVVQEGSVDCRIGSGLWGVEAMLPFAQEAFGALTDGVDMQTGSPEGQNILPGTAEAQHGACSGFHVLLPQTMLWVQILRQGNDGTCASDGTSVMRMIF
jgi:hypothetical protein